MTLPLILLLKIHFRYATHTFFIAISSFSSFIVSSSFSSPHYITPHCFFASLIFRHYFISFFLSFIFFTISSFYAASSLYFRHFHFLRRFSLLFTLLLYASSLSLSFSLFIFLFIFIIIFILMSFSIQNISDYHWYHYIFIDRFSHYQIY